jgi:hypothetical protein
MSDSVGSGIPDSVADAAQGIAGGAHHVADLVERGASHAESVVKYATRSAHNHLSPLGVRAAPFWAALGS